jgi:hypothetical protein
MASIASTTIHAAAIAIAAANSQRRQGGSAAASESFGFDGDGVFIGIPRLICRSAGELVCREMTAYPDFSISAWQSRKHERAKARKKRILG